MEKWFMINESAVTAAPKVTLNNPNTIEFIAVLQEANKKNRNGRIYNKRVLEEALASPYVRERIQTNSFYGEAGHPMDPSMQRQMTVDNRNIAFLIKEFWWEGDLLKGRIETANTVIGRDMKGLIEQGSKVAFSLRAHGKVEYDARQGAQVVTSPIKLVCYDWVVNPSHDAAFLERITTEGRETLLRVNEHQSYNMALTESTMMYNAGRLIESQEGLLAEEAKVLDYTKAYFKRSKVLSETYIYDSEDVFTTDGKLGYLETKEGTKKVVLEDYIRKDVRSRILGINKEESK